MFGSPKGSLKFSLEHILACSPVVIGSMIHYMLLLNVEVHFLDNISKGKANSSRTTHTLNIYGGTIDVRFVLSSKGTLACNSSSSIRVLVLNRTSPSLLHTFVVDTLLNFPLPFNIQVILTYTNTSPVKALGRLLVRSEIKMYNVIQLTKSIGNNETIKTSEAGITDINFSTIMMSCGHKNS